MSFKSWINDRLPDWAWNLKNRLTGNPYRTQAQKVSVWGEINYDPAAAASDAQGLFIKDGPVKLSPWFEEGAREAIKRAAAGGPANRIAWDQPDFVEIDSGKEVTGIVDDNGKIIGWTQPTRKAGDS